MFVMVVKKLDPLRVTYKFIESDNLEDVKTKYKNKKYTGIEYIGEILRETQKRNLINYGNTIISNTMLNKLGQKDILKEVKRITGYDCEINVSLAGTVVLTRC